MLKMKHRIDKCRLPVALMVVWVSTNLHWPGIAGSSGRNSFVIATVTFGAWRWGSIASGSERRVLYFIWSWVWSRTTAIGGLGGSSCQRQYL